MGIVNGGSVSVGAYVLSIDEGFVTHWSRVGSHLNVFRFSTVQYVRIQVLLALQLLARALTDICLACAACFVQMTANVTNYSRTSSSRVVRHGSSAQVVSVRVSNSAELVLGPLSTMVMGSTVSLFTVTL